MLDLAMAWLENGVFIGSPACLPGERQSASHPGLPPRISLSVLPPRRGPFGWKLQDEPMPGGAGRYTMIDKARALGAKLALCSGAARTRLAGGARARCQVSRSFKRTWVMTEIKA